MASGFGAFGGSGRCFPIFSDFATCVSEKSIELCEPYRSDYFECLHNLKEYTVSSAPDYYKDDGSRAARVREAIRRVEEYQPKVGKEL
ncbi:hypothetical protein SAMD00019534_033730 [Acytostelium subglobosum LB1]|uniref:hypothetical protein n=1 Tax=Acytostelium subglobosum LB1 TaxID=1410327 RepID=UPI000644A988|nr:hypothetical protein SAMD00019534_033730 [Acytostelium subglobosum LB1]GAM20198.1 hypothetical protein SAMD00019534_033730 [Acytostelium subglobosum LB1]|eukprot:XP_012759719.1 hypothetical protein SAMD00019534_033730 [Acytostelium subglobosum LB1]